MKQINYLPIAIRELQAALKYYDNISPTLGERLLKSVEKAEQLISEHPALYPKIRHSTRRAIISHFPYNLLYVEHSDTLTVIAFMSQHRQPDYWHNRQPNN